MFSVLFSRRLPFIYLFFFPSLPRKEKKVPLLPRRSPYPTASCPAHLFAHLWIISVSGGEKRGLSPPVGLNESAGDHNLTFSLQSRVGCAAHCHLCTSTKLVSVCLSVCLLAPSIKAGSRDTVILPLSLSLFFFFWIFSHRANRGRHFFCLFLCLRRSSRTCRWPVPTLPSLLDHVCQLAMNLCMDIEISQRITSILNHPGDPLTFHLARN